VRRALYADLLVLGQYDAAAKEPLDVPTDFVPSMVIDSGRPTLLIPHVGAQSPVGRSILVGWKETREAARAVAAALPWMQVASHVHVALWHAEEAEPRSESLDIERFLRAHGITPKVHHYPNGMSDIAAYLLSLAADVGAGMIVMGCYGHSRMREWALGGTTRTVLQSMTVPVLMTH
jgi:nucleotide-binding universal stress UspA family protein